MSRGFRSSRPPPRHWTSLNAADVGLSTPACLVLSLSHGLVRVLVSVRRGFRSCTGRLVTTHFQSPPSTASSTSLSLSLAQGHARVSGKSRGRDEETEVGVWVWSGETRMSPPFCFIFSFSFNLLILLPLLLLFETNINCNMLCNIYF